MTREEAEKKASELYCAGWVDGSNDCDESKKTKKLKQEIVDALCNVSNGCQFKPTQNNPSIRELMNLMLDLQGNISETIQTILRGEGYTGLVNLENGGCGCPIDDLFLCGHGYDVDNCRGGYLHKDGKIYLEEETEENNKCRSH